MNCVPHLFDGVVQYTFFLHNLSCALLLCVMKGKSKRSDKRKLRTSDMVLNISWLLYPVKSSIWTLVVLFIWCSLALSTVECQRMLHNADDGYNDYYNDLSDEEQEYPQRASLNDGRCSGNFSFQGSTLHILE